MMMGGSQITQSCLKTVSWFGMYCPKVPAACPNHAPRPVTPC